MELLRPVAAAAAKYFSLSLSLLVRVRVIISAIGNLTRSLNRAMKHNIISNNKKKKKTKKGKLHQARSLPQSTNVSVSAQNGWVLPVALSVYITL